MNSAAAITSIAPKANVSNPDNPIRLILVCQRPEAGAYYRKAAGQVKAVLDQVISFRKMFQLMCCTPYNGILVDLPTKLKAPKEETQLLSSLLDRFPVVQLSVDSTNNTIIACHYGQISSGKTLESFIIEDCAPFTPRTIRSSERLAVHLHVLLCRGNTYDKNKTQRTATLNLSRGGSFIISTEEFQQNETIWVAFHDFPEFPPVQGTVCWLALWGVRRNIPGIGIKFVWLDEKLAETLLRRV